MKSILHSLFYAVLTFAVLVGAYHWHRNSVISEAHASTMAFNDSGSVVVLDAGVGSGSAIGSALAPLSIGSGSGVAAVTSGSGSAGSGSAIAIPDPATINPMADASSFIGFLTTGKYLPAIGILLMLIVWAERAGLAKVWPWWTGKMGGYILGIVNPLLLYIGTALSSGTPLTIGLITTAAGVVLATAGGWSHLVDIFEAVTGKQPASTVTPAEKAA